MPSKAANLFNLRVLLRYDDKYAVHVAHCIETGNVVTADSSEEAESMIKELLEDEILFALKHQNLKNLFSSPARLDVLVMWMNAARENGTRNVVLDINFKEVELPEIEPQNSNIKNELTFARAA
jgi:hypothetical protein